MRTLSDRHPRVGHRRTVPLQPEVDHRMMAAEQCTHQHRLPEARPIGAGPDRASAHDHTDERQAGSDRCRRGWSRSPARPGRRAASFPWHRPTAGRARDRGRADPDRRPTAPTGRARRALRRAPASSCIHPEEPMSAPPLPDIAALGPASRLTVFGAHARWPAAHPRRLASGAAEHRGRTVERPGHATPRDVEPRATAPCGTARRDAECTDRREPLRRPRRARRSRR